MVNTVYKVGSTRNKGGSNPRSTPPPHPPFLHYWSVGVEVSFPSLSHALIRLKKLASASLICTQMCVGFQTDVKKFFLFYLTLSLTSIGGAAIAYTFSAMVSVFAVANLLVSLVFVFYMVSELPKNCIPYCYYNIFCGY